ncbi:MAG TPA: STAS domain-containing protein [Solirubrobacteraceae bacterium]|nr:STAS domain-containing protein [Solirubrobacteraceae bacterium]
MDPTADEFDVRVEAHDREVWVVPVGELDLGVAPELRESLDLALSTDAREVVIDLRELELIDSTGLGVIVDACTTQEGRPPVSLVPGSEHVQGVFNITGLASRLPFRSA